MGDEMPKYLSEYSGACCSLVEVSIWELKYLDFENLKIQGKSLHLEKEETNI